MDISIEQLKFLTTQRINSLPSGLIHDLLNMMNPWSLLAEMLKYESDKKDGGLKRITDLLHSANESIQFFAKITSRDSDGGQKITNEEFENITGLVISLQISVQQFYEHIKEMALKDNAKCEGTLLKLATRKLGR